MFKIKKSKTYIISEIGGNHNGSIKLAKEMIYKSWKAGADAVKFQTFLPEELATKDTKIADYQKKNIKKKISSLDILKICQLRFKDHIKLKKYSKKIGIDFLSSAFDMKSLIFLSKDLKMKNHKIPSGEITNFQLLFEHGRRKHNIILSTGMSSIKEIKEALNLYLAGYLFNKKISSIKKFIKKNLLKSNLGILKKKVVLLHCISNYPTKLSDLNLKVIQNLKKIFDIRVGLSDHTRSILTPAIAVAMGAKVIEKHITLNRNMTGPDHKSSILPKEFSAMVKNIRNAEKMLGIKEKKPNHKEIAISRIARKHLITIKKINKGDFFSTKNISSKRGNGSIKASKYWNMIGIRAKKEYEPNTFL